VAFLLHYPCDTVSCTQAEALILTAESCTELRPWRRTDLMKKHLQTFEQQMVVTEKRQEIQEQDLQQAQNRISEAEKQLQERQAELEDLEKAYQARQRKERPTSRLAQARKRWQATTKCLQSRQNARGKLKSTDHWKQQTEDFAPLNQRLERFEQENAINHQPVEAEFRLDAGFGSYENVALLIEMGYEVYTKPHSHHVVAYLRKQVTELTD
jgi:chromosome segregation ATPase